MFEWFGKKRRAKAAAELVGDQPQVVSRGALERAARVFKGSADTEIILGAAGEVVAVKRGGLTYTTDARVSDVAAGKASAAVRDYCPFVEGCQHYHVSGALNYRNSGGYSGYWNMHQRQRHPELTPPMDDHRVDEWGVEVA